MYGVGDVVRTKKSHPCGCDEWEILRVGMDFRIRCAKCAHLVMLPRKKFEKSVKKIIFSKPNSSSEELFLDAGEKPR